MPKNGNGNSSIQAITALLRTLRTLRYIAEHEPSLDEACSALGISRPTVVRHVNAGRTAMGMDIRSVRGPLGLHHYQIFDFGLINRRKLLQ